MSTTAQGIDARGYLVGWANALAGMTTADINATPDDKWNETFGGCTRPASALMADAISLMAWTTEALKGNVTTDYEEDVMEKFKADCSTKAGAAAKLQSVTAAFCEALTAASDEALNTVVTPPWQMATPLYMIANIAVSHIWYHDGQLNYIQCLLGDEKVHWMGD